jgi:fatty acid synthase subunit beta
MILEQHGTTINTNQNRIPYPDRLPVLDCQFLPISAAFHSPHVYEAYRRICERPDSAGLFKRLDFTIPIYHTYTGEDIHLYLRDDCVPILARAILCEPVDWAKTCMRTSTTHILDFGRVNKSVGA